MCLKPTQILISIGILNSGNTRSGKYAPAIETRELEIILIGNCGLMEGLVMWVLEFRL